MARWTTLAAAAWLALGLAGADGAEAPAGPGPLVREMLAETGDAGRTIVFAVRPLHRGGHAYESFGYNKALKPIRVEGGRLVRMDLAAGRMETLVDDPAGAIRDPEVSYDGRRIVFSWRRGEEPVYHLWEIGADGGGLRQLTSGADYDDVEPCLLPSGDIVFVSSRAQRWVPCFTTQVGLLMRRRADGTGMERLSPHVDQDMTPCVMGDGRIAFTRWDYIDRHEQGTFHLWSAYPDGSRLGVAVYGDQWMIGYIDAQAIDRTRLVAIESNKNTSNHAGRPVVIDLGESPESAGRGSRAPAVRPMRGCPKELNRDPYPISGRWFLVAGDDGLYLVDDREGRIERVVDAAALGKGMACHEPRVLGARPAPPVLPEVADPSATTGRLVIEDVYAGRPESLAGIERGDIASILVLENLPAPIRQTDQPVQFGFGSIWGIKRVLGTFPVEADGSASAEVPALRSLQLIALDAKGQGIKRMHASMSVMPGETLGCVGCHERRYDATPPRGALEALARPPSRLDREGVPEIIDYPRDIQPIWDRHCTRCHDADRMAGGLTLAGDRGIAYPHSLVTLVGYGYVSAAACRGGANPRPRSIGSPRSPLLERLGGGHKGTKLTPEEIRLVTRWIDVGVPYAGTFAADGTGVSRVAPPEEVLDRRCFTCHGGPRKRGERWTLLSPAHREALKRNTGNRRIGEVFHLPDCLLWNLSKPEASLALRAPLAKEAGGLGWCKGEGVAKGAVFANTDDADYGALLDAAKAAAEALNAFDRPGFRPTDAYIREMKRYGYLPETFDVDRDTIDWYELDERYYEAQYRMDEVPEAGE